MHTIVALLIAAGRAGLGIGLAVKPERVARGWLGEEASKPIPKALVTGLGTRDAALGLALLSTGGRGRSAALLLLAGVAADLSDLVGTVAAGPAIPVKGRVGTIALAGGAALAGLWAAPGVARPK